MQRTRTTTLVAVVVLGLGGLLSAARANPPDTPGQQGQRHIVVLKESAGDPGAVAAEHSRRHDAEVVHVYRQALKGYAARFRGSGASDVARDSRVAYVEPDREMKASTTQKGATWGLDRIDQRPLPLSGTFTYTSTGNGVKAYIIDTGIRFDHSEFGERAVSGYDAVDGGTADDCNGHGTHVAGTTGGPTYSVAKDVTLVAVRVLDCLGIGWNSDVIAGVNWVTGKHQDQAPDHQAPAVANMSLGGGRSSALVTAVKNSIAAGVSYAVAAGNGNAVGSAQDACKSSPANVKEAMTIAAADKVDIKATWSNYGTCVDWYAPGVSITSAWHLPTNTATNTISGTSMAAPHTAGVAALYLQTSTGATPSDVRTALYDLTTKGVVKPSDTTNNHLLFTNY